LKLAIIPLKRPLASHDQKNIALRRWARREFKKFLIGFPPRPLRLSPIF
jgi:hypothetical protein